MQLETQVRDFLKANFHRWNSFIQEKAKYEQNLEDEMAKLFAPGITVKVGD